MIRHTLIALAGLAILLGSQVSLQAQTTINFLPTGDGDWGTSTNWSDPNMVGAHVPQSPFDEIVTIGSGGTAIVSGAFTNATDPAGPAGINLNAGTLRIENSGQLTAFPSGFGSPGADGHVTVNGRLNVQGGGKLNASNINFGLSSTFDVDVTAATASPVTVEGTVLINGGTLSLDYSGVASPLGKRTLITSTSGFVFGEFDNVEVTGIGVAQRNIVQREANLLTANVVNVPTVSINRQSGVATITNTHSTPIALDGIVFRSPLGAFDASKFTGLGSGWLTPPTNSATHVGQAFEGTTVGSPTASLAPGASLQIGGMDFFKTPYPSAFLQETEDVVVELTSPTIGVTPATAVVNYTGEKIVNNNIVLAISPATGIAQVANVTNFPQEIEAYRISSTTSPLQTGTWSSFDNQNTDDGTWRVSTQSNATRLLEAQEGGTTTFSATDIYNLGKILNTGFTQSGITFEYLLAGQDAFTLGAVVFGALPPPPPPKNLGDFNGNGIVDAADYTLWRNNLNQPEGTLLGGNGDGGTVGPSDYQLWKTNFGTVYPGSGGGAVGPVSVPEPSAVVLLGLILGMSFAFRGRNR